MYMYNVSIFFFFFSCLIFSKYYKNLFMSLICMEYIMLNLLYLIYMNMMNLKMNLYFINFYLVIVVCESIMGLTLLLYIVRMLGNDYFFLMNLMKW
uniref:NADH-ubiquinone oxidoreductase chain 4L n=1 Tax=Proterops sp. QL-2014 TaxID=1491724 RepID=A0A0U1WEK6_9HYME|nr:NADH dehydrogenase subunit 4L [Proterops sp. QL-2014]